MNRNTVKIWMLIPVILMMFAIVALLIPGNVMSALNNRVTPTGSIIIYVNDGGTDEPLENAKVVIPETGQSYWTDKNGKTPTIRVPIVEDVSFSGILPKPWGEITVMVYKEGFVDCAIFHICVWENQTRNGPTVLLFPLTAGGMNEPFTLTEGPSRLWVKQLLDKYR